MSVNFDIVLEKVGANGRFQKYLTFLFIVPINIFGTFMMTQMVFQVVVPDHWCHVPPPANASFSPQLWKNITIPRSESGEYSKCLMYAVNWTGDQDSYPHTNTTTSCKFGWDHDTSQFTATVATTLEWFCERDTYSQHILAVTSAGYSVGSFLLPFISEKYLGQRWMLLLTPGVYVLFVVPVVFVTNAALHLTLRFMAGLAYPAITVIPFVIGLEVVKFEHRAWVTGLAYVAGTIGMCSTSLVAYLIPHWQYLTIISCVPFVVTAPVYWWFVPDSPRWLLSKGRLEESSCVLQMISRVNGRDQVSLEEIREIQLLVGRDSKELYIYEVFHFSKLRQTLIRLLVLGMCFYACFGIVFMGIDVMPSNYFLSNFILSVFQLPSNILTWLSLQYLGRRFTVIASGLLAALFSLIAAFCLHNEWQLVLVTGMIRMALLMGSMGLLVYTPELMPTPIRNSGLGLVCTFAAVSMMISPYIIRNEVAPGLRYWVMLALMLVAVLIMLQLPETLGLALPQTFLEAEHLGSGRPLTTWIHHWNHRKYRTPTRSASFPTTHPSQESLDS